MLMLISFTECFKKIQVFKLDLHSRFSYKRKGIHFFFQIDGSVRWLLTLTSFVTLTADTGDVSLTLYRLMVYMVNGNSVGAKANTTLIWLKGPESFVRALFIMVVTH